MRRLKEALKLGLPLPLLQRLRRFRSRGHYRRYASLGDGQIFAYIYRQGLWGRDPAQPFRSGTGSLPEFSQPFEDFAVRLIEAAAASSIVDLGCGDFQVSRRILERLVRPVRYLGLEVVAALVEHNRAAFGSESVRFAIAPAEGEYPEADVMIIRQVLQHNSNANIARILAKARRSCRYLLIAEHVPERPRAANLDIRTGHETRLGFGSGVFVDRPPFDLPVEEAVEFPMDGGTVLRVTVSRFGREGA
jgi:SAM-dependent methyltransferase